MAKIQPINNKLIDFSEIYKPCKRLIRMVLIVMLLQI